MNSKKLHVHALPVVVVGVVIGVMFSVLTTAQVVHNKDFVAAATTRVLSVDHTSNLTAQVSLASNNSSQGGAPISAVNQTAMLAMVHVVLQ